MSSRISRFHLTRIPFVTQEVPKRKDEKRREKLIIRFMVSLCNSGDLGLDGPCLLLPGGQVPLEAFRSLISLSDRRRGTYSRATVLLFTFSYRRRPGPIASQVDEQMRIRTVSNRNTKLDRA